MVPEPALVPSARTLRWSDVAAAVCTVVLGGVAGGQVWSLAELRRVCSQPWRDIEQGRHEHLAAELRRPELRRPELRPPDRQPAPAPAPDRG